MDLNEGRIWRFVFYPLGVLTLCLSVYVLFANGIGHSVVLVVIGALFLLAPRLKDLIKLEIGVASIKAEMQQVVTEARATLDQLHLLAAALGKQTIRSAQAEGRWGGRSRADRSQVALDTASAMRALGMTEVAVNEVLSAERPFVRFDYAHWVTADLKPTSEQRTKWNEFSSKHNSGIGSEPSPEELRKFLVEIDSLSAEIEERLKDYEHYVRTAQHRRPDVWFGGRDE